ncbi:hypothetical protein ANAPRD1_00039 [Anaplasma phagocytophilum]|nr:hypothetical protein ANAPRD1_00039 [Anaplasma phagocytophilum]SCV62253.1 hypothetical protein ANAPH2_00240 [Anaplasma phagocytophilum]SCV62831.1 hypothetical protein ANAPH1_00286 [Anaplasma phagocytophilum]
MRQRVLLQLIDADDGVFDLSRYVTPRNQTRDSRLCAGTSSSSRAPQGAGNLASGTSLTSLDSMVYGTESAASVDVDPDDDVFDISRYVTTPRN